MTGAEFCRVHARRRYASVVSKLLPATGHPVLDAVRNDTYYCVLIPLLGIPLFLFSYLNWLSFKLFRHN